MVPLKVAPVSVTFVIEPPWNDGPRVTVPPDRNRLEMVVLVRVSEPPVRVLFPVEVKLNCGP